MRASLLRSSAFRLSLLYMALFGASVLVLMAFIYWSTATFMADQTDATIEAEIDGLAERYRLDGLQGLSEVISDRLSRNPVTSSLYLLARLDYSPVLGNLSGWPNAPEGDEGWIDFELEGLVGHETDTHPARARVFALRGGYRLLVGRDLYELKRARSRLVTALAWGLGITVLLGLAGGIMMSRSMLRRIEAINDTSREIMDGDLSRRIPGRGSGDDFDQLAANLNAMLERIQSLMDGVRQVSDNIAHDLRTPLARLRNRLDQLRGDGEIDARRRELAEEAVSEADALLATFNALLRIARIEAGSRREGFTEVDLSALVEDVAELYEPLAEERGQRFTVAVEPGVALRGDRELLSQAAANLLDNAIKYSPDDGAVHVTLARATDGVHLVIADGGPGIPEEFRERALQRFFRLESSRSTPGNGLGLSLVAAVAGLHGARLVLEDNAPGLRATTVFPLPGGGGSPRRSTGRALR